MLCFCNVLGNDTFILSSHHTINAAINRIKELKYVILLLVLNAPYSSKNKIDILLSSRKHAYIILTPLNPTFL